MTQDEWDEMGLSALSPNGNYLVNIIDTEGEPDTISQICDSTTDKNVQHPVHYGGKDNPYEAINIIEAYSMSFCEGNVLKYLLRYKKKNGLEDLKKAHWYLERLIKQNESQ